MTQNLYLQIPRRVCRGRLVAVTAAAALATTPGETGRSRSGATSARSHEGRDLHDRARLDREASTHNAVSQLNNRYPDYAPDGSLVAFQHCALARHIYTVHPGATGLTGVGAECSGTQPPPPCADSSYAAISPGAMTIAFVRTFGRIRKDDNDHLTELAVHNNFAGDISILSQATPDAPRVTPTKPHRLACTEDSLRDPRRRGIDASVWARTP